MHLQPLYYGDDDCPLERDLKRVRDDVLERWETVFTDRARGLRS
jgi:hypothetical protein